MAKQTTKQKQKKVEAITGEELTQKVKQLDHQLSKAEKALCLWLLQHYQKRH